MSLTIQIKRKSKSIQPSLNQSGKNFGALWCGRTNVVATLSAKYYGLQRYLSPLSNFNLDGGERVFAALTCTSMENRQYTEDPVQAKEL